MFPSKVPVAKLNRAAAWLPPASPPAPSVLAGHTTSLVPTPDFPAGSCRPPGGSSHPCWSPVSPGEQILNPSLSDGPRELLFLSGSLPVLLCVFYH